MRQDVNTAFWGPAGWEFLNSVVEGYPETANAEERLHMTNFLRSLGVLLPCKKCRANYNRFADTHNPANYVASRGQVAWWLEMYKTSASPVNVRLQELFGKDR